MFKIIKSPSFSLDLTWTILENDKTGPSLPQEVPSAASACRE
jgi:hypothetical protein